ncbi:hypothetical protein, partial [Streptomyces chryseus]|uniref:hypothetical protein n=1 Tax=Streptomyces chryseus TaxID=68186 RepID=UPI001B881ABC
HHPGRARPLNSRSEFKLKSEAASGLYESRFATFRAGFSPLYQRAREFKSEFLALRASAKFNAFIHRIRGPLP